MNINNIIELKKSAHILKPNELLDYSTYFGWLDGVKLAFSKNAKINYFSDKPIKNAVYNNHIQIVEYLLTNNANVNSGDGRLLNIAIEKNNIELCKLLIKYNIIIDINFSNIIYHNIIHNNLDMFKFIVSICDDIYYEEYSLFEVVMRFGSSEMIDYLLTFDIDFTKIKNNKTFDFYLVKIRKMKLKNICK